MATCRVSAFHLFGEEVGVGGWVAGVSQESTAWNRAGRSGWMEAEEPMGMTCRLRVGTVGGSP